MAILAPLAVYAADLPKIFSQNIVDLGAKKYTEAVPCMLHLQDDSVYPENPDTCYTYDTYWDSMTGKSMRIRQIYSRFRFYEMAQTGYKLLGMDADIWDEAEQGRNFVKNNFKSFKSRLKNLKTRFWKTVKKECKVRNISYAKARDQYKKALVYEIGILEDLSKMTEADLTELSEMMANNYLEMEYLVGYSEEGTPSYRSKVNGFLASKAGLYKFKNLKFVHQADGLPAMDFAWFFNISMLFKYRDQDCITTLKNFKEIAQILSE